MLPYAAKQLLNASVHNQRRTSSEGAALDLVLKEIDLLQEAAFRFLISVNLCEQRIFHNAAELLFLWRLIL